VEKEEAQGEPRSKNLTQYFPLFPWIKLELELYCFPVAGTTCRRNTTFLAYICAGLWVVFFG